MLTPKKAIFVPIASCPVCGQTYDLEEFRELDEGQTEGGAPARVCSTAFVRVLQGYDAPTTDGEDRCGTLLPEPPNLWAWTLADTGVEAESYRRAFPESTRQSYPAIPPERVTVSRARQLDRAMDRRQEMIRLGSVVLAITAVSAAIGAVVAMVLL